MAIDECNADVYKYGQLVGIYDMPKEIAEASCKLATEQSGCLHDWHYVGGRVYIKALPKDWKPTEEPPESPWA